MRGVVIDLLLLARHCLRRAPQLTLGSAGMRSGCFTTDLLLLVSAAAAATASTAAVPALACDDCAWRRNWPFVFFSATYGLLKHLVGVDFRRPENNARTLCG